MPSADSRGRKRSKMSTMAVLESQKQVLSKVALFSGLTDSEMEFVAGRVLPRKYAPGKSSLTKATRVPDSTSSLPAIRIFKTSASGREQVLNIDGPGSSVAELPVFDGGNYPASVAAVDEAVLLFVSKESGTDSQLYCFVSLTVRGKDQKRGCFHTARKQSGDRITDWHAA
jgi:Cyclic nucleotide-binding domain